MNTGMFFRVSPRHLILLLLIGLAFFSIRSEAQGFQVSAAGPTTVKIEVKDAYSWFVQERNGSNWTIVLQGGAGSFTHNLTRPAGTHVFRLDNCFPTANGCSTSASKSVTL